MIDDGIEKDRELLLDRIFGDNGLVHADDEIYFDVLCEQIEEKAMELSPTFHRYFTSRVKLTVKELWSGPTPPGYFDKNWTNNNCESLNQVLKASINWESKPLLDLVTTLKEIVDAQFKDLLRSLVSRGQYRIA